MHTRIDLVADGVPFFADAYLPLGEARHGALIVVHEWHGLNDGMRAMGKRFAEAGFVAIVPDLYAGEVASDDAGAAQLMQAMKTDHSLAIFAACAKWAKGHGRVNGKVGIVGFCMGGAMTFAAATRLPELAVAVPFYGLPMAKYLDASQVVCPIQAHFARHDDWARPDTAAAFRDAVNAAGGVMELHVYDAGHAFMRVGGSAYSAVDAKLAWERAVSFLTKRLES